MLNNIKNEILNKNSFSKVFSIAESTIHALRWGGGKNLRGKSLRGKNSVKSNSNLKTILFGIFLSLLVMQCSKSTDPVTSTPASGCPSGQSKNANSGLCEVDLTLCQNGQGKANACTSCDTGYTSIGGVCIVQNNLVISVNSLTMYASNGYTASFTITTDQNWTITGAPAWLSVSPTSGAPGTALKVNLTTTTLNTTAGLTGSLSVNATGKPELNKTLNLTRTHYTSCGGTLGLPGPSIVVAKWVSMGAAEQSVVNLADPNGRFLVAVAKGCGGGNTTFEFNLKKAIDITFDLFLPGAVTTLKSSAFNFTESVSIGAFVDRGSLFSNSVSPSLSINNDPSLIVNLQFIPLLQGETGFLLDCSSKNQYLVSNLANLSANTNPKNTCITDTQFPPELKDTMNALLRGAGKTYSIP